MDERFAQGQGARCSRPERVSAEMQSRRLENVQTVAARDAAVMSNSFTALCDPLGTGNAGGTLSSGVVFRFAFAVLFAVLIATTVTLGVQGDVTPCMTLIGLFSSPAVAGVCAFGMASITERYADERDRRELENARRQRHEANLKLLVLQAQIEPHFLFNTLSSLRALLREDIDQAEALVDAFVAHLRAVLPALRTESVTSTLSEQLAICASYLELMSVRLDGRLVYEIDAPESLWDADVPPLVLPTLVENAIKHGIERKSGSGYIRIDARRLAQPTGACIAVSVTDDGAGFTAEPRFGIGLSNVSNQLALRYGDRAAVSLTCLQGRTVASLIVPYEGVRG